MDMMASSAFTIESCIVEDVPTLVDIYLEAFADSYINSFWIPQDKVSLEAQKRWLYNRFAGSFPKREVHWHKAVDAASGEIAAFVRWTYPHVLTAEEKRERDEEKNSVGMINPLPEGVNMEAYEAFFGGLDTMRAKYVDYENFYACQLLATSPKYQRKGLGALLLNHTLAKADVEGKTCYIEATEAGHILYSRLGWKDVDLIKVDCARWGGDRMGLNWVMLRQPRTFEKKAVEPRPADV